MQQPINPAALLGNSVIEVRALAKDQYNTTYSGYFDNPAAAYAAAMQFDGKADVYLTLNEPDPAHMSRKNCGVMAKVGKDATTSDRGIIRRRWLLLDADPVRVSGVSSTDAEKVEALVVINAIKNYLAGRSWPEPVICDSGNGYHLLYHLDLPNDDTTKALIRDVIKALSGRFSNERVKLDEAVFNASRITKFYGVLTRKGGSTKNRPHRRSHIVYVPPILEAIPWELLQAEVPKEEVKTAPPARSNDPFNLDDWLSGHGIWIKRTEQAPDGGTRYILADGCPFNPEHSGKDAVIYRHPNGAIGFKCFHDSCAGKGWKEFREYFEPDAYKRDYRDAFGRMENVTQKAEQRKASLKLIRMSDIKPKRAEYLIFPYVPKGKLTIVGGVSGSTKTWFCLNLASIISCGANFITDDDFTPARQPACVLYQTKENDYESDIRPRLDKLGGNLDNIVVIDDHDEDGSGFPLTLSDGRIEEAIEKLHPALLIFDPIQSYIGAELDFHKANEVRPVLDKLIDMAKRYNCAVILVSHMSKQTTASALDRLLGSSDFRNAARSILIVGSDPQDKEQRVVAHAKNSLGQAGQSIKYHIDSQAGVVYDGFCDLNEDQIVQGALFGGSIRSKPSERLEEATTILHEMLEDSGFAKLTDIQTAANLQGISKGTLYNAKSSMALQSVTVGFSPKVTYWIDPEIDREEFKLRLSMPSAEEAVKVFNS